MPSFDITQLNKSSFKGYPFYTQSTSHSGGKRLTIHKFINGGTSSEENGLKEKTFSIEAYLGGENYLKQKEDFIKVLDSNESGELIDLFYGTKTVFVDSWTSSEDKSKLGIVTFSITFIVAEDKVIVEDDIVFNVDYKSEVISNFKNEYNPNLGDDILNQVSLSIKDTLKSTSDTFKFLSSDNDFAQNIQSGIVDTTDNLSSNVKSVTNLADGILNISSLFDGILDLDTFDSQSLKSITTNIKASLESATNTNFNNTIEESVSQNSKAYNLALNSTLLQTAVKTLEITDFTTGDSFGDVKSDMLDSYDILIKDIETNENDKIENIQARQNLLDKYKESRKEFITFYTQKYSKLQNLNDYDYVATTNAYDIALNKYKDIDRIDEVIENNDILDPLFVNGNLKLLDR